ncbi:MAG: hypothetical protein BWK77_04760 [Verrucomicrobia bacterium A1]|nr:MAG: hypothetical protein BWK77_04760 [Verrucomicrobia bacterium A1]
MPSREVLTLLDLVYYQYAKIVAQEELTRPGFEIARRTQYGMAKDIYHDLKAGRKLWGDVTRGNGAQGAEEVRCAFCGRRENVEPRHLVPRSLHINERCGQCERLLSQGNLVPTCADCAARRGTMGLYAFYRDLFPEESKFYYRIPRSVEKKYLRIIYDCLRCADALGAKDVDGDGDVTVLDIDYAIARRGKL